MKPVLLFDSRYYHIMAQKQLENKVLLEQASMTASQRIFRRGEAWVVVTLPHISLEGMAPWLNLRRECGMGLCCYVETKQATKQSLTFVQDLQACIEQALLHVSHWNEAAEAEYQRILPRLTEMQAIYEKTMRLMAETTSTY